MRSLTGSLTAATLSLLLGACADGTGPLPPGDSVAQVRSAGSTVAYASKTRTTTTPEAAPTTPAGLNPLAWAADAPPLTTYDTTFVFKQGNAGTHKIRFKGVGVGADTVTFLRLTVPKFAQFVDAAGNPLRDGGTVCLTVHVDRETLAVEFGPHGSTFTKRSAILELNYGKANLAGLDPTTLAVWYQPDVNTAWSPTPTTVDIVGRWLTISLDHFSNYAVAY